jgi:ABC-type polysaccharide/polyol phosphate export permease
MVGYLTRMWACRYFWLSLVRIDLRARYRRSVLGVGWSLVRPIVLTVTLCVVFQRLFHRPDTWSFAPYLLSGLIMWDYVTNATKMGCLCFFQGESYIRQHPTPAAIFPLRIALGETIHFLFALVVLVGLTWYIHGPRNPAVLLSVVPVLVLLFLLAWSLASIAGFANVYFQDTQHLCDVGFQMFFYATPIVYELKDLIVGSKLHWVVSHLNPLVPFLDLLRKPLLYGQYPPLETFGIASLVVAGLGAFSCLLCARLQRRLIFQL